MAIKEQDKVFYEELANGDKVINLPVTRVNNVEGLGRSTNTAYVVGDVVYTDNNNKVALKCITAGITSNAELNISTKNIGDTVNDGTVVWKLVSRVSDGMPVGFKYFDWVKEIPVGALGALGALYNRELYADLWKSAQENKQVITEAEWQALAQANDGNVPWYSDGDGSTTFRVPALKCWVKGASGIEEIGNYLEAGIPNIEGEFEHIMDGTHYSFNDDSIATGAFIKTNIGTRRLFNNSSSSYGACDLGFDASKSNSIYGNSDTVQPPSLIGIWLIKAYGTVTNIGNADVANVMRAVEQVQTSIDTLEQGIGNLEEGIGAAIDYIVDSWRNGAEWYEVYKSGKVRQGGEFNGSIGPNSTSSAISLNYPFDDTDYFIIATNRRNGYFGSPLTISDDSKTTTSFKLYQYSGNNTLTGARWYAEGKGA